MSMIAAGELLTFVFLAAVGLLIIMIFVTVMGGPRRKKRPSYSRPYKRDHTQQDGDSSDRRLFPDTSGQRMRDNDRDSSGDDSGGDDGGAGGDGDGGD